MTRFLLLSLLVALAACAPKPHQSSGYAGLEAREIKALSDADIARYQNGEGGGDALAAELNGLAGPKHVLELADELQLSPRQLQQTEALYERMHREATAYGAALVEEERALDKWFAGGGGDELELLKMLGVIGNIRALVRYVHLSSHLRQDAILNDEQRRLYVKLRGYHNHNH